MDLELTLAVVVDGSDFLFGHCSFSQFARSILAQSLQVPQMPLPVKQMFDHMGSSVSGRVTLSVTSIFTR